MRKIYILSGEIQTGKSEFLMDWVKRKNVGGFITPTINGKKMLFDVVNKRFYPFQLLRKSKNAISIGKYFLHQNAFFIGKKIIEKILNNDFDYIILDEIGKLELRNEGYHDLVLQLLEHSKSNLLFVIRDSLLEEVVEKYNLENIIFMIFEKNNKYFK